jgi:drug/metabolite transporter (DMT)-like permease
MFQRYGSVARSNDQHQPLSVPASLFAVLLCTLFGANAVALKIALTGLGIFTAAGIRFSIACIIIYLWARFSNQPIGLKKGRIHQLLILTLLFVAQIGLFYSGLSRTYASRAALIVNLVPFFVLLISHWFTPQDAITKKKLIGIIMGFTGVVFVFLEKKGITSEFQIGDMIILIATLLWACNGVYTKKIIPLFSPFQIVFYPSLFSLPLLFMGAFLFDTPMISFLSRRIILAILYQSLVTGSFGFVVWTMLLQKYGAVSLHTFIFIMPVVGVFLGGLILSEPITGNIITALVLIGAGIFITQFRSGKKQGSTNK